MNNTQSEQELRPASWPLLFSHKSRIDGKGYSAEVELSGRLLAELEMEGVWLYGVNPGAIAVGATTLATANVDLHNSLHTVFMDFAEGAATFADFKKEVERFFNESDPTSIAEWEGAVARVKCSTTIEIPGGLPVRDANTTKVFVRVAEPPPETSQGKDDRIAAEPAANSQLARAA